MIELTQCRVVAGSWIASCDHGRRCGDHNVVAILLPHLADVVVERVEEVGGSVLIWIGINGRAELTSVALGGTLLAVAVPERTQSG